MKTNWLRDGPLVRAVDASQVIRSWSLKAELGKRLMTDDFS